MAGYADYEFYKTEYLGAILDAGGAEIALEKASREIDYACQYRIQDFEELTAFQQRQVKLAVCVQADHDYQYGELADYLNVVGSYSVGDISVTGGGKVQESVFTENYGLVDNAVKLLMPTNLLDRRLG